MGKNSDQNCKMISNLWHQVLNFWKFCVGEMIFRFSTLYLCKWHSCIFWNVPPFFLFIFFFFFDLPIFNSHTLYLLHLPPLLAKLIAQYEQSAFTAISYMIRMFALYNVSDDIDSKLWMSCCSALDFKSISQIIHIWLILSKADNFT